MPGRLWKANVNELNDRFDRCREEVDRLIRMEDEKNYQLYNGGGTTVEVSIKTKKASSRDGRALKWDTILSQDEQPKTKASVKVDSKPFVRPTKSSRAKAKPRRREDAVDSSAKQLVPVAAAAAAPANPSQLTFPHRTLGIFLYEMRSALRKEASNAVTANKILDDLEFVAANLNVDMTGGAGQEVAKGIHQEQLIQKLKREQESRASEVRDLKMELSHVKNRLAEQEKETASREQKVSEQKSIIAGLKTRNGDMLALLKSKVPLHESAEEANRKLLRDLAKERKERQRAEAKCRSSERERVQLAKILSSLRQGLNTNVEDVKAACEEALAPIDGSKGVSPTSPKKVQDSTVDLCLSSDRSDQPSPGADETPAAAAASDDDDSAIGNSESHTLTSAAHAAPRQSEDVPSEPPSLGQAIVDMQRKATAGLFRPVPLNLSETVDSSVSSGGTTSLMDQGSLAACDASAAKQLEEERRKMLLTKASGNVNAKVQEFLNRMRNDKRFQVSISSEQLLAKDDGSVDSGAASAHLDFTSEVDSTALTESKFMRGLEATLNLSGSENDSRNAAAQNYR